MKYGVVFLIAFLASAVWAAGTKAADNKSEAVQRIAEAAKVFDSVMSIPDKAIPRELLEHAKCIGILPGVKKGAFIVGARYGKGVMVCRTASGWTGPSTVTIEGGSIGAQIGGGETDIVLMVMNQKGADRLMKSEFTLGGDAAVMAGPVGRTAEAKTDLYLTAEILSYSRSRGVFAGVSLDGSTLRADDDANAQIYGKKVDHATILKGEVKRPASARGLYDVLNKYIPVRQSKKR